MGYHSWICTSICLLHNFLLRTSHIKMKFLSQDGQMRKLTETRSFQALALADTFDSICSQNKFWRMLYQHGESGFSWQCKDFVWRMPRCLSAFLGQTWFTRLMVKLPCSRKISGTCFTIKLFALDTRMASWINDHLKSILAKRTLQQYWIFNGVIKYHMISSYEHHCCQNWQVSMSPSSRVPASSSLENYYDLDSFNGS